MAINIIGEDAKAKKVTTCGNCSAVLEYTHADTKVERRTDYTGCTDEYRALNCPRCGNSINVKMY